ncbi:hypothetical protein BG004_000466 [Podila humilis]|nr:hypothetical protein BG004_000466 [Podila humilis]
MPPLQYTVTINNSTSPFHKASLRRYSHNTDGYWNADDSDDNDDHDDFWPDIYEDFVLLPPRARSRQVITQAPPKALKIRAPYLPPEILGLICEYSSLKSLIQGVQLVCRNWRSVAKLYIGQEGLWRFRTQREEDELISKMQQGSVKILTILSEVGQYSYKLREDRKPPFDKWPAALDRFLKRIATWSIKQTSLRAASATGAPLIHNIGKVVLQGQEVCEAAVLDSILPHLGRVHTLEIFPRSGSVGLHPILNHCKRLESLKITAVLEPTIVWSLDSAIQKEFESQPLGWYSFPQLTSFEVKRFGISSTLLTRLISSLPELKSFVYINFYLSLPLPPLWPMPRPEALKIETHLAPFYRQAAAQCPNLEEFMIYPHSWSRLTPEGAGGYYGVPPYVLQDESHHVAHMHHTHTFFRQWTRVSLPWSIPSLWQPSQSLVIYLSDLTHLNLTAACVASSALAKNFTSQALDLLLRFAVSLENLQCAPGLVLKSSKSFYEQKALQKIALSLELTGHYSTLAEIPNLDARDHRRFAKRMKREVTKALIKESSTSARLNALATVTTTTTTQSSILVLPHPTRWMCKNLTVACIGVNMDGSLNGDNETKAVFRQLAHCCPLIVDLTIEASSGFFIGQTDMHWENSYVLDKGINNENCDIDEETGLPVKKTRRIIRRRGQVVRDPSNATIFNFPEGYRYDRVLVKHRYGNPLLALGGGHHYGQYDGSDESAWKNLRNLTQGKLTRLERLCFVASSIPGSVSISNFEFMRTKDDIRDSRKPKRSPKEVYWPRLKQFTIRSSRLKVDDSPGDRIDANDSRPLSKKLEGLRPGVVFELPRQH